MVRNSQESSERRGQLVDALIHGATLVVGLGGIAVLVWLAVSYV